MKMAGDALVLDHSPFRDRHAIVSLLTAEQGLLRGVSRNVRGTAKSSTAALQILSKVHFQAYQKAHAELATLTNIEILRSSYPLAGNLGSACAAAVVAELLLAFCPAEEPAGRRYRLGTANLEALLAGIDGRSVVSYSQIWILKLCGLLPDFEHCSHCGENMGETIAYGHEDGLPLCGGCAQSGSPVLSRDSISALATFSALPPTELRSPPQRVLRAWLDLVVRASSERSLPALSFFRRHLEHDR